MADKTQNEFLADAKRAAAQLAAALECAAAFETNYALGTILETMGKDAVAVCRKVECITAIPSHPTARTANARILTNAADAAEFGCTFVSARTRPPGGEFGNRAGNGYSPR